MSLGELKDGFRVTRPQDITTGRNHDECIALELVEWLVADMPYPAEERNSDECY